MYIPSTTQLQFGPARCSERPPISFPSDRQSALALAGRLDREADAELSQDIS